MSRWAYNIKIGFWNTPDNSYPDLPNVDDCIDEDWNDEERKLVVEYLAKGRTRIRYLSMSRCRCCGKLNGSTERTDGKFIWPSGFAHYIVEHGVKPPNDFVEWVKNKSSKKK